MKLLGAQRIDLLITDVGLPGLMNGRQLADAARTPQGTQSTHYNRLCGECRGRERTSRTRNGNTHQTFPDGDAREQGKRDARLEQSFVQSTPAYVAGSP